MHIWTIGYAWLSREVHNSVHKCTSKCTSTKCMSINPCVNRTWVPELLQRSSNWQRGALLTLHQLYMSDCKYAILMQSYSIEQRSAYQMGWFSVHIKAELVKWPAHTYSWKCMTIQVCPKLSAQAPIVLHEFYEFGCMSNIYCENWKSVQELLQRPTTGLKQLCMSDSNYATPMHR
jgi:hypothetical protein